MSSRVKVSYLSLESSWRHNKDRHGRDLLSSWGHRIWRINSYSCLIPVISTTLSTDLCAIDLKKEQLLFWNRKALVMHETAASHNSVNSNCAFGFSPITSGSQRGKKKDMYVYVKSILNICQISNSATLGRQTKTVRFQFIFLESPDKLRSDGVDVMHSGEGVKWHNSLGCWLKCIHQWPTAV